MCNMPTRTCYVIVKDNMFLQTGHEFPNCQWVTLVSEADAWFTKETAENICSNIFNGTAKVVKAKYRFHNGMQQLWIAKA